MLDGVAPTRTAPCNYDAERALLGAILMNNRAMERVGEFLRPHHFADPVNGLIYDACARTIEDGKQANPVTMKTLLENSSLFEEAGGTKYVASLAAGAVTIINAIDYGRLIYETFQRREMIQLGEDMVNAAYAPQIDEPFADELAKFEGQILKLTGTTNPEGGFVPFRDILDSTYQQWEYEEHGARGVPTGFVDLDNTMGGLHPGDLIILAGRPSMGKSAIAINIAFNAAVYFRQSQDVEYKGRQVAVFSLEMSAQQIGARIITGQTAIVAPRNRWGKLLEPQEWAAARNLVGTHGDLPFIVDDGGDQTVSRIRARCIRHHRRKPLGLIVIDYLQLMSGEVRGNNVNRVEQISQITRGLKKLAKELNIPVIALSQLSRAVEQRENKRPVLSDLRESGSIEQDADIIVFPFRPEYYLQQDGKPMKKATETQEAFATRVTSWQVMCEEQANICEMIIAKQRHGPLGVARLHYDNKRTWFENAARKEEENQQENLI